MDTGLLKSVLLIDGAAFVAVPVFFFVPGGPGIKLFLKNRDIYAFFFKNNCFIALSGVYYEAVFNFYHLTYQRSRYQVDRFENAHNACVRVLTKEGLHARPASQIAALLSKSEARLTLVNKATSVAADGSSVLDMLMMEAGFNTEVSLSAEGPEAGKILAEVVRFFNNKFDEEES